MEADNEVFRVRVDLRRVCSDERSRVLLGVPCAGRGGARRVRWLARRVRALLGRPEDAGRLALMLDGHLLPESEPLSLLRPGDELTVIPVQGKWDPAMEEGSWSSGTEADSTLASPPRKRTRNDNVNQDKEELLRREKLRALELVDAVSAAPLVPIAPPPAAITPPPPAAILQAPPVAIISPPEPDALPLAPKPTPKAPTNEPLPRVRTRRRRRRRPLRPEGNSIQHSSIDQEPGAPDDPCSSNMQLLEVPLSSAKAAVSEDYMMDAHHMDERFEGHDSHSRDVTNAPDYPDTRDFTATILSTKAHEATVFDEVAGHAATSLDVTDGAATAAVGNARRGRIIHAIDVSSS